MWLSRYIEKQGLSRCGFAVQAGVAPSTVTRLLGIGQTPQHGTVLKLADATHGKVSEMDILAEAAAIRVKRKKEKAA